MGNSGRRTSNLGPWRAGTVGAAACALVATIPAAAWAGAGGPATGEDGGIAVGWLLVGAALGLTVSLAVTLIRRRPLMARLREAERRNDEALAVTSHELRTPLTSVIGFAHTLREAADDLTDDERDEIIGYIADEAESTLALVEDLLVMTGLREGEVHVHSEVIPDLAGTVRTVVERSPVFRGRGIRVLGTAAAVGDEGRLRQVVRNLLSNAVEHGEDPISVTIGEDDSAARIVVTDGGRGIPQAIVDGLFDRLRSGPTHDLAERSTGIGLWLSRELSRQMGGDLCYLGAEGGTSFEVTLPLGEVHATQRQAV